MVSASVEQLDFYLSYQELIAYSSANNSDKYSIKWGIWGIEFQLFLINF